MTCHHISIDHNKNLILCISPKWETNKKKNSSFAYRRLITYRYDNLTREERSGMLPVRLQFLKLLKNLKYKACINLFLCNEMILDDKNSNSNSNLKLERTHVSSLHMDQPHTNKDRK